ncbi:TetR/AcrR family transcriptional regulator [Deinococcus enclensis]|uniref:AcrR family transcriptional regulator n=1 Tax=Deinococcus enclensis TaxID=1049582 RepID=A0ABT9MF16_9DEIO|nr:TetR/AcrR family transcriptional regulator [Deinococcus enclensis]MDP9765185.1 AcrR family transcriptional regulator [Deinococcus enclensis]
MKGNPDTLRKILTHTYDLIAEEGIDRTALSALAQRVGIAKPTLYYYFPTKDDLIAVLFEEVRVIASFDSSFKRRPTPHEPFEAQLIQDGVRSLEELAQNPSFSRVLHEYFALGLRERRYHDGLQQITLSYPQGFETLLSQAVESGHLRAPRTSIPLTATLLALTFDGLSNQLILGLDVPFADLWATQVHLLLGDPT